MRLVLIAALAVGLALATSVAMGVRTTNQSHLETARNEGLASARLLARGIGADLAHALDEARATATTVQAYLAAVPPAQRSRALIEGILRAQLAAEPGVLGVYVGFEPGGFDAGERFLPYCSRGASGAIAIESLAGMEDASLGRSGMRTGEYYLRPKEQRRECVIDPYPYMVQGRETWMTSMVVPLMVDGTFVGIAGVDMALAHLDSLLASGARAVHAHGAVVSPAGILAGAVDLPVAAGSTFAAIQGPGWTDEWAGGSGTATITPDGEHLRILAPFTLGADPGVWTVALQVDMEPSQRAARQAGLEQVGVGLLAALLALGLAWFLAGGTARLICHMTRSVEAVATGDYSQRLDAGRSDELGRLARALNATVERLGALDQRLRTGIGGNASALSSAAAELDATSTSLADAARIAAEQAQSAASGAEEVTANVNSVATAIEELSASSKEIAGNASEAARIAREGVQTAGAVAATVTKLGETSKAIGEIVRTIAGIAEQTNLLALNATIEAARAGEAGRGFAVVAGEVKELARQSALAAQDIAQRIAAIQGETGAAVEGVKRVADIVGRIDQTQQAIAAAIEEQTATTAEVGRTVSEAATGNQEIATAVAQVAGAATTARDGTGQVQQAANELSRLAAELQRLVAER